MKTPAYKCFSLCLTGLLIATGLSCGKKQSSPDSGSKEQISVSANTQPEPVDPSLVERIKRERWTGDLNGMAGRRYIRALVTYNKSYYFYDGAEPRGISYETLKEFEKFLNQKLGTGNRQVNVIFIPVQRGDLIQGLLDGRGDIAASNIAITPEGLALADYSDPIWENVSNIVVTGPGSPALTSLDDLAGKEVFVRKLSRYWSMFTEREQQRKLASGR